MPEIKLSTSSINTYFQCPRKFYWSQVKGIFRKEEKISKALDVGTDYHALLQGYNEKEFCRIYEEIQGYEPSDEQIETAKKQWIGRKAIPAKALYKKTVQKYPEVLEFPEKEKSLEREFGKIAGMPVILSGRCDAITADGVAVDYKTTSEKDFGEYLTEANGDTQSILYTIITEREEMIYYVAYSFGRLSQKKGETEEEFQARIEAEIEKEGLINRGVIEIPKQTAIEELKQRYGMLQYSFEKNVFPQHKPCKHYNKKCDYWEICHKRPHHEELYNFSNYSCIRLEGGAKYPRQEKLDDDFMEVLKGFVETPPVLDITEEALREPVEIVLFKPEEPTNPIAEALRENQENVDRIFKELDERKAEEDVAAIMQFAQLTTQQLIPAQKLLTNKEVIKAGVNYAILQASVYKTYDWRSINAIDPDLNLCKIKWTELPKKNKSYIENMAKVMGVTEEELFNRILNVLNNS